jgi:hypothetical protein
MWTAMEDTGTGLVKQQEAIEGHLQKVENSKCSADGHLDAL